MKQFVSKVEKELAIIFAKEYKRENGQNVSVFVNHNKNYNVAQLNKIANKDWSEILLNGNKVAVAASGGKDSMALVLALQMIGLSVVALIVNHNLRKTSHLEAEQAKINLESYGIESVILEWKHNKITTAIEEQARTARYEILINFCKNNINNIKYLFLGHHLNDQVETVIMNLARGTGINGLSGMKPVSTQKGIKIIRPMLNIQRDEIEEFIHYNNIPFVEDPTNKNLDITRNKLRNCLKEITNNNKKIDIKIAKTASTLQEDNDLIKNIIEYRFQELLESQNNPESSLKSYNNGINSLDIEISSKKEEKRKKIEISAIEYFFLNESLKMHLITRIFYYLGQKSELDSIKILANKIENTNKGKSIICNINTIWDKSKIVFSRI